MKRDPTHRVRTTAGTVTVAEIEARCTVLEPGMVLVREIPNATADTFEVMLDRAEEIGAQFETWAIVADLSEANQRPKGRYLETIRKRSIGKLATKGQPVHLAAVQPGNPLMRVVLVFVHGRLSSRTSIHTTLDAAVSACRDALVRHREQVSHAR